jgi:hypothetical protein
VGNLRCQVPFFSTNALARPSKQRYLTPLFSPYGIDIAIQYQVLDQNGNGMNSNQMQAMEKITNQYVNGMGPSSPYPNWVAIWPSSYPAVTQYTNSSGQFWDAPFGFCGVSPETWSFTQPLGTQLNGTVYPVRTNNWSGASASGGHGSITNGVDISNSR